MLISLAVGDLGDEALASIAETVALAGDKTVVVKLPNTFSDMRAISELCEKYATVRVCGGNVMRLAGCRVGCIEGKGNVVCVGCSCGDTYLDEVDAALLEFSNEVEDKPKMAKAPKVPRASKAPKENDTKEVKVAKTASVSALFADVVKDDMFADF